MMIVLFLNFVFVIHLAVMAVPMLVTPDKMCWIFLQIKELRPMLDPASSLPFINTILSTLRKELAGESS